MKLKKKKKKEKEKKKREGDLSNKVGLQIQGLFKHKDSS